MFAYTDPTGTGALTQMNALSVYQQELNTEDRDYASIPESSYVLREALDSLTGGQQAQTASVSWLAFPKTAGISNDAIDSDRTTQDEYVEWRIEKDPSGRATRITFTTEFASYYAALAAMGIGQLTWEIQQIIPGANPTAEDLFGPGFDPNAASPESRAEQLWEHALANPWNNGAQGILFLQQGTNTLGALFDLIGQCAIPVPDMDPASVCPTGHCVAARNSDPHVCQAAQGLAQAGRGLSLQDPVGVRICSLTGIWKIDGKQVDINDPADNQGVWTVSRNGRRGVLDLSRNVTLGDDSVSSGAQVAAVLEVAADVLSAPKEALPTWAKSGQPDRILAGQSGGIR